MYFKSLVNDELQQFHRLVNIHNFSISLSEILTSTLFKKEQITPSIYRIYPLFYCKEIITNDTNTKILENKCILTGTGDSEKYFNFITDDDTAIIYDGVNYYTIGDTLSTSDFNAFIQILKNKLALNDNIRTAEGTVNGSYAKYRFNLEDVSVVDNGILITEETLNANPTVRLFDPVFKNSSYTLKLDVFSVADVNVLSDVNQDNTTHETLTIPLELNTDVELNLGDLDFNKIVLFDAVVEITHDKPVISFTNHLNLSVSGTRRVDESLTLTALYDEAGTALEGKTITFYDGTTVIGTDDTDSTGVASITYVPRISKEFNFKVACLADNIVSETEHVVVSKQNTIISLSSNKATAFIPTTFTVSGVLKNSNNEAIANAQVKLYNNGSLLDDSLVTNSNGAFSKSITANNIATFNLQAQYKSSDSYNGSESGFVSVTARKYNTNITANLNNTEIDYGESITITGTLTTENGIIPENRGILLIKNNTVIPRTTTVNNNGQYIITYIPQSVGVLDNLKIVYPGNVSYNAVDKTIPDITVYDAVRSIVITNDVEYELLITLYDKNGIGVANKTVDHAWLGIPIQGGYNWVDVDLSNYPSNNDGEITFNIQNVPHGKMYVVKDNVTSNTVEW